MSTTTDREAMADPKQDEVRALFEAWAKSHGLGCQLDVMTWEWKAWQAASLAASMRAAQVCREYDALYEGGWAIDAADAIEADAGIKGGDGG